VGAGRAHREDQARLKLRGLWLAVGWAMVATVVWLSVTPAPPTIDFQHGDKLGHFLAYGSLMFWFSQLYGKTTRMFYAAGFIAMGIALEFVQGRLEYRTYEVYDMYANALGVLLGWALALILPRLLR
jgi:VanZ family protein